MLKLPCVITSLCATIFFSTLVVALGNDYIESENLDFNSTSVENNDMFNSPLKDLEKYTPVTRLKVFYDGRELDFKLPFIEKDNIFYYPFADLVELIGGNIEWKDKTKSAIATLRGNSVEFFSNSNKYIINGRVLSMESLIETAVPLIENEKMYIPIQYVFDGLGLIMSFSEKSNMFTLDFKEPLNVDESTLNRIQKSYGNTIAVYYENLETGYTYAHNADKIYFAASVVKAPYCLYVYDLAEKGQANLSSSHKYSSGEYRGGTGVIKNMRTGITFTENELLKYSIRNSDNIALSKLISKYGTSGYREFVSNIGGNSGNVGTVTGANMSSREAGLYAKEIYKYIELDNKYGKQFKEDLMSTSNAMIISDFPIARKYGWANNSFHDMSIIYSDSPYILVVMSARAGSGNDFAVFRDISKLLQHFNENNFVNNIN